MTGLFIMVIINIAYFPDQFEEGCRVASKTKLLRNMPNYGLSSLAAELSKGTSEIILSR